MRGAAHRPTRARTLRNRLVTSAALAALIGVNAPVVTQAADEAYTTYRESRPAFEKANGHWETLDFPDQFKVNAIHAVLLRTGKILIIAGSGNDQQQFDAGTFTSILWDPVANTYKLIKTPKDLFCGGHAQLPDGNVLVAGGTAKYEVLADKVENAAGVMTIHNEDPGYTTTLPKGTVLVGQNGKSYRTEADVMIMPAHKMPSGQVHASQTQAWVRAAEEGRASVVDRGQQFSVRGLPGNEVQNVYGIAQSLTLDKQEYRGIKNSYIFNVTTEQYQAVGDLVHARWYPTLVQIPGGNIMAVSGLDEFGVVSPGNNEVFERTLDTWFDKPNLYRYFPTYPALFMLKDGRLFYSSSNAGYGSDKAGRTPGFWNLKDNTFTKAGAGLRAPEMNETSASVLLPPAQDQKVMIVGGGAVGDKDVATNRVDVIDTDAGNKTWAPGPDLPEPTRYPSTVILPNDQVLITGGSSGYRGKGDSDLHASYLYDVASNALRPVAPNHVGRDYHSEALLLPDGRVITLGSNPLYADKEGKIPGTFEQRVEIYTPPYLFNGDKRPVLKDAPERVKRGTNINVHVDDQSKVVTARLLRPSAVTHVTDVEQRSVALDVTKKPDGSLDLTLDKREGVVPSGWYMLFTLDAKGTPSVGRWVQVE